jgi:hypothetical protein
MRGISGLDGTISFSRRTLLHAVSQLVTQLVAVINMCTIAFCVKCGLFLSDFNPNYRSSLCRIFIYFLYLSQLKAFISPVARHPPPPVGQGFHIIEASRSHSETTHSVELLWTSDRPVAENSDNTQHSQQISMLPARFEPAISASERPQTHSLDRAATGI